MSLKNYNLPRLTGNLYIIIKYVFISEFLECIQALNMKIPTPPVHYWTTM